jgi:hypothetical protein
MNTLKFFYQKETEKNDLQRIHIFIKYTQNESEIWRC